MRHKLDLEEKIKQETLSPLEEKRTRKTSVSSSCSSQVESLPDSNDDERITDAAAMVTPAVAMGTQHISSPVTQDSSTTQSSGPVIAAPCINVIEATPDREVSEKGEVLSQGLTSLQCQSVEAIYWVLQSEILCLGPAHTERLRLR